MEATPFISGCPEQGLLAPDRYTFVSLPPPNSNVYGPCYSQLQLVTIEPYVDHSKRVCSRSLIWSLFEDLPSNPFGGPPPDDPTPGVLFGDPSPSPFGDPIPGDPPPGDPPLGDPPHGDPPPGDPPPGGPLVSVVPIGNPVDNEELAPAASGRVCKLYTLGASEQTHLTSSVHVFPAGPVDQSGPPPGGPSPLVLPRRSRSWSPAGRGQLLHTFGRLDPFPDRTCGRPPDLAGGLPPKGLEGVQFSRLAPSVRLPQFAGGDWMGRFDLEDELTYAITSGAVACHCADADGLKPLLRGRSRRRGKRKQQRQRIGAGR